MRGGKLAVTRQGGGHVSTRPKCLERVSTIVMADYCSGDIGP